VIKAKRSAGGAVAAAALSLLMLGPARPAAAQRNLGGDVEPQPARPWAVKLGMFLATEGDMKDQAGEQWLYGGLDYFPNLRFRPLDGDVHFGFDAIWKSRAGSDFHSFSLSAKVIWPITDPFQTTRVWGGVGVGVYHIQSRFEGATVQPGGKFLLGVDFGERWFAEVNYDWVGGYTDGAGVGLNTNGITIAGGYRF